MTCTMHSNKLKISFEWNLQFIFAERLLKILLRIEWLEQSTSYCRSPLKIKLLKCIIIVKYIIIF